MVLTIMCANMTVVLGGASSGKSDFSEKICFHSGLEKIYLASAQAFDEEMRTKAEQHRTNRGPDWCTIEEPFAADRVISEVREGQILLFDCATLWLTNHFLADHDLERETESLLSAIRQCPAQIVVVSNEVGLGIVPENALARRFRIAQGALNRRLAEEAGTVVGVMAGLPFVLKGALPEGLL
ncbi:adenosylcobinamide kinase /adenosylcobinamide-phosphate guanylyltransferase [Celeribacter persicus]|uniref:Bifunctional adenosylcobalamin biosynthesis protein n=2 Tax=Celeribacter persicus TaxID=1651082 RepID=A0A2T5HGS2_9RHOB|nr:adenosylcobinamide kinase /adenosylcobinamide-phosphate guanylyltransferase [Celeribacter persicus]